MPFHRPRKGWHPSWRQRMPLVRLVPPVLEPGMLPSGTSGAGSAGLDWANLIAALGGNTVVPAFYDARSNVTTAQWQDVRGAGFGPLLTATGVPILSGAGPTARVTVTGTQWYQSALSPLFDLSHPGTLVVIATLADAANVLAGVGTASNNPNLLAWPQAGNAGGFYEPAGDHVVFGSIGGSSVPNGPSVQPCDGRLYAIMVAMDGATHASLVCWPGQVTTFTLAAAMTAGNALFSIGADPGHAVPCGASFAGALYLNRVFTASDAQLIGQFAFNAYGAFNNAARMFVAHGDSLTVGKGLADFTQNYPAQIIAGAPFQTQWATVNVGLDSQTMAQMIVSAPVVVDPIFQ